MGTPIDRTAKTALDSNLVNGNISDAPKIKSNNDEIYNYVDGLNNAIDTHAAASTLPHADGSVVRAKLASKAVGPAQLDDLSVGQAHLQDNGIPSRALPDNVILNRHMSDNSVGPAEIQSGAVTGPKVAPGSLTADKFVPGALSNETQNALNIIALRTDITQRAINVHSSPYNAVGDGVADDTEAIEKALLSGLPIIGGKNNVYKTTRMITVPFARIVDNLTIKPSGVFQAFDIGQSVAAATTTMTGSVIPRSLSITVANATGFQVGQLLKIDSDKLWYYDNRGTLKKGELHLIKAISGNTITLSEPIWDVYDTATETVIVQGLAQTDQTIINGLRILYPDFTEVTGMRIRNSIKPIVNNLIIEKCTESGLTLSNNYGAIVTNPQMIKISSEVSSDTGYGIQDNASFATTIINGFFYRCRRGVDFSGVQPSRGGKVMNSTAVCYSQDVGDGFGTHGTAEFIEFLGNTVYGGRYGFLIRGSNTKVIGNMIYASAITSILHSSGDNIIVEDNTSYAALPGRVDFSNATYAPSVFYTKSYGTTDTKGVNIVKGNTAVGIRQSFINLYENESQLIVKDNIVHIHSNGSGFNSSLVDAITAVTLSNSLFANNTLRVTNGVRKYYTDIITLGENVDYDERMLNVANLEVWNGTGALANVIVDVAVTKINGIAAVVGTLKFDVLNSTVKIALNSIPRTADVMWSKQFRADNVTDILCHTTSANGNKIFISSNAAAYNTDYAVGTNYKVCLDIRYKTSKDYNYA